MITFETNLTRLLQLKNETQNLMIECLEKKQKTECQKIEEADLSKLNKKDEEIDQLKIQSLQVQDHYEQQMRSLNERVEALQSEIEIQNFQFDQDSDTKQQQIDELQSVLQQLQERLSLNEQQHRKEVENLKLMHSQELYILKKRK